MENPNQTSGIQKSPGERGDRALLLLGVAHVKLDGAKREIRELEKGLAKKFRQVVALEHNLTTERDRNRETIKTLTEGFRIIYAHVFQLKNLRRPHKAVLTLFKALDSSREIKDALHVVNHEV